MRANHRSFPAMDVNARSAEPAGERLKRTVRDSGRPAAGNPEPPAVGYRRAAVKESATAHGRRARMIRRRAPYRDGRRMSPPCRRMRTPRGGRTGEVAAVALLVRRVARDLRFAVCLGGGARAGVGGRRRRLLVGVIPACRRLADDRGLDWRSVHVGATRRSRRVGTRGPSLLRAAVRCEGSRRDQDSKRSRAGFGNSRHVEGPPELHSMPGTSIGGPPHLGRAPRLSVALPCLRCGGRHGPAVAAKP